MAFLKENYNFLRFQGAPTPQHFPGGGVQLSPGGGGPIANSYGNL